MSFECLSVCLLPELSRLGCPPLQAPQKHQGLQYALEYSFVATEHPNLCSDTWGNRLVGQALLYHSAAHFQFVAPHFSAFGAFLECCHAVQAAMFSLVCKQFNIHQLAVPMLQHLYVPLGDNDFHALMTLAGSHL